ncbi:hypothetical protein ZEAMMB73_Zm00001d002508 [Zea mays]|uniref:Uncharacterized protein n=1 Tax=Zea mays TaxID=4577 RepID=A0A1D6E1L8_MAIZE|nr:hypothetical protein ZEAMMB73_Zm00001d002508 [Zea mays]
MGLLYLIKEDHIVWSPHLFSQLPTLFTADVASVIGKKILAHVKTRVHLITQLKYNI